MATVAASVGEQVIEHMTVLRRYARVLVRTQDQADDLVQDTIERALARADLYQPGTNLRAWLFTIMRNICITNARKLKLRRTYAAELMSLERHLSPAAQDDIVMLKESLALVQQLSPGEQQAVTLLGVQDMSYETSAEIAALPVGTMKSRLSRGRQRLRSMIDGTPQTGGALPA
jgi:RNA polymerase sigma-70 factor (ECF subfamily)